MKRRTISLHYCNRCRMTTRHTETLETATCTRCGIEKPAARGLHPKSSHRTHEQDEEVESVPESGWN